MESGLTRAGALRIYTQDQERWKWFHVMKKKHEIMIHEVMACCPV
jgi:hypothetical protein